MSALDYQNSDDAKSEKRSRFRLKLFGPSREKVWRALAAEMGARYVEPKWWGGDRVTAEVGQWEIVLDWYHANKVTYTRMRAPYVNADGFRFHLFRKHFLSGVAEWLGFQDVRIGEAAFDDAFVVRGNDEAKLRALLARPRLRALLEAQPEVSLRVVDDEGFFRKKFPAGVDKLEFIVVGVIKDIDRLKLLYELFAETLQALCEMGSAYEDHPGVRL